MKEAPENTPPAGKEPSRSESGILYRYRRWLIGLGVALALYSLLGFLLVPWLIDRLAVREVGERFGAGLRMEKVAVNPFLFTLRIDGLAMDDPQGRPFLRWEQFLADFELSSLFRWAWTFKALRLDRPELVAARDADGSFSFDFLLEAMATGEEEAPVPDEEGTLPRLLVHDFAITDAALRWSDAVPAEPVETRFGPITVAVTDLGTLPGRDGLQDVLITTETGATVGWSGSLKLNPLTAQGTASLDGALFSLLSAYLRNEIGYDVPEGILDLDLRYALETRPDGALAARVEGLQVTISDLLLRTYGRPGRADRTVLQLPSLSVVNGRLRWPEQVAGIDSVLLADPVLSVYRDESGELDLLPPVAEAPAPTRAEDQQASSPLDAWDLALDRFEIQRMEVGLRDESVQPPADLGLLDLNLAVTGISNEADAAFPVQLDTATRGGGTIHVDGAVTVLPAPVADLNLDFQSVVLALLHPYIQPLADVNFDSGALELTGSLRHAPDELARFEGDVAVVDFLITETVEGSRLGSWERITAADVAVDLDEARVDVAEVRVHQAFADVFIAEDGSVNLGRIQKGEADAGAVEIDMVGENGEETLDAFDITIGRVVVSDGAANFADQSLPLPFEAAISELNGNLTTIASKTTAPSEISLEGKVDEYGSLTVSGTATPLDPLLDTDVKLAFRNVQMPKFSAYSIPFAGREIASGRLDLDLQYRLENGELVGENGVVLTQFELGEKVPHPGAMSLPLGMAVALLKDPGGKIDIDLPVRGNVNDPEFKLGGVIVQALANLILKIVASPFNLLGGLLGVEPSELEYIAFAPGRAELPPPEVERAGKLAEALALRPLLVLEVPPVSAPEADGLALRTAALDAIIEARVQADESGAGFAEARRQALETLLRERAPAEAEEEIAALEARHTSVTTDEDGKTSERFDAVAHANALREALLARQPLDEGALRELAAQRAENVRAQIVAIDPTLAERIVIGEAATVEAEEDGEVRARVKLSAG